MASDNLREALETLKRNGYVVVPPCNHHPADCDGPPCYAHQRDAALLAGQREQIAEVLRIKLGEIGFEGIDEPLRSQVIQKWAGALADAVVAALTEDKTNTQGEQE